MTTYQLPNITSMTNMITLYVINRKQYTIHFSVCCNIILISIYVFRNQKKIYIVKNRQIVPDLDLLSRVKNPDLITGRLIIKNKHDKDIELSKENFHTDFEMEYYEE